MIGYLYLISTIIIESLALTSMKLAGGYENKLYFGAGVFFYTASFFTLNAAFKYLPLGWTNAIWAGSSTVIMCIIGFVFFHEKMNWLQGLFFSLILIGLIGLNFFGKGK